MLAANASIAYLAISLALLLCVGATLHRKGRLFLLDSFRGNEPLATAFGVLRIVSFYLITLGFITVMLPLGTRPADLPDAVEYISWKVGLNLLMLGMMHAINVCILSDIRRRALRDSQATSATPSPAPPPSPA